MELRVSDADRQLFDQAGRHLGLSSGAVVRFAVRLLAERMLAAGIEDQIMAASLVESKAAGRWKERSALFMLEHAEKAAGQSVRTSAPAKRKGAAK